MKKNHKKQQAVPSVPIGSKTKSKPLPVPPNKGRSIFYTFRYLAKPALFFPSLLLRIKAYIRYFFSAPLRLLMTRTAIRLKEGNNYIYRLGFVLLLTVTLIGMPVLSFDYGITWDEKIQRDYGKEIIEYYSSGRKDTSLFDQTKHLYNTMLYYGCSFDVLTNFVHDTIAPGTDEFELRHFINALFGVFTMLFTALIARYLGSWRTACIAFVFALLSPSLFGHSMNNPKDIPFAASYIFTIYFMMRFLRGLPYPRLSHIIYIIIGIGWTISTRAGGLILLAFLGIFMAVVWMAGIKKRGLTTSFAIVKNYALYYTIIAIGGYLSGLIIWPYGQRDPLHNPLNAVKSLSNVNYLHTYENFDGERIYMSDVPWYYVIKHIGIGSPLFVLIGCVLTLVLIRWVAKKYNPYYLLLLIFIFAFPVFYVAYKHSMVYNGWRHFLFVYLSLVVIASVGWDYVITFVPKKLVRVAAFAILCLFTGNVAWWMIRNHPDQYIYFNELAGGTKGANGNYEMDYYSNTVNRAVKWLVENEKLQHKKVKVVSNNELLTVTHYMDQLTDSVQVLWTRDYERQKQDWDYAIFTSRTFTPSQIKNGYFPPTGTIHTIDVDGVPVCAIIKRPNKLMSQGYSFSTRHEYDKALPFFEQAIAADPKDEEAYRSAGLCLLNLNSYDAALVRINKCIELNPEGFMAYYLKGFYYLSINDKDSAEKEFKMSIKNRINNGDAHAECGNIYLDKGMTKMALDSYTSAIGFGHSNPNTYTNMGICYMNINDYDNAIKLLNMAINKNENFLPAYEKLQECFIKLGDYQTAEQVKAYIRQIKGS